MKKIITLITIVLVAVVNMFGQDSRVQSAIEKYIKAEQEYDANEKKFDDPRYRSEAKRRTLRLNRYELDRKRWDTKYELKSILYSRYYSEDYVMMGNEYTKVPKGESFNGPTELKIGSLTLAPAKFRGLSCYKIPSEYYDVILKYFRSNYNEIGFGIITKDKYSSIYYEAAHKNGYKEEFKLLTQFVDRENERIMFSLSSEYLFITDRLMDYNTRMEKRRIKEMEAEARRQKEIAIEETKTTIENSNRIAL